MHLERSCLSEWEHPGVSLVSRNNEICIELKEVERGGGRG